MSVGAGRLRACPLLIQLSECRSATSRCVDGSVLWWVLIRVGFVGCCGHDRYGTAHYGRIPGHPPASNRWPPRRTGGGPRPPLSTVAGLLTVWRVGPATPGPPCSLRRYGRSLSGSRGIEQTMADATGRSSVMTTALSISSGRMRPSSSSTMSPRVRAMVGIFCRSGW